MSSAKGNSNKSVLRIPVLYTNNVDILTKMSKSIMNLGLDVRFQDDQY